MEELTKKIDGLDLQLKELTKLVESIVFIMTGSAPNENAYLSTSKWWHLTGKSHPLSQVIKNTLERIKKEVSNLDHLQKLLYNPCRGSISTTKEKHRATASSPLIPYLLYQAGFPILLDDYTDKCSHEMYEDAVSTLRAIWKTQRKKMFPKISFPRTGGAGTTCYMRDCRWFQQHYEGLDRVTLSDIIQLILRTSSMTSSSELTSRSSALPDD